MALTGEMAVTLFLSLLLLTFSSEARLQFVNNAKDDPNSEIVFNVSKTTAAVNSLINVTCGLASKNPVMIVEDIKVIFNNAVTIPYKNLRSSLLRKSQNWACSGPFQMITENLEACRTNRGLLVKANLQPSHTGNLSCDVVWGNFGDPKDAGSKLFRGVKSVNLTVLWPSKIDYTIAQSKPLSGAPPGMFGPFDVVLGEVNVSCGYVIDSNNADKPRMSGLKGWKTVYDDKKMKFGGVTTIHMKKTKVVTLADNGTQFECSIGNQTVRRQLRVRFPPRITKALPSANSTVFVGSNITCETEGDPPAAVYLEIRPRSVSIFQKVKGFGKITYELPLDGRTGSHEVVCESFNAFGTSRKSWRIEVKNFPMKVSFPEIRQQSAGSFLNLSCSTSDPDVEKIFFGFVGRRRLFELRVRTPEFLVTSVFGRKKVKLLPYTSKGITVLKVSNKGIKIMMQVTRDDNGKKVECVAIGKGKRGIVARHFLVSWPPSVKDVIFENQRDRYSPVKRFSNVTVQCKFYLGNPALPMEIIKPTAKIGSRDLGPGYEFSTSPLLSLSWTTLVTRGENGLDVTCSLVNRTLNRTEVVVKKNIVANIQYPPSISLFQPADGTALLPTSVIRCAADANPVAFVALSARRGSAALREIGRGESSAEGRLEGAEGPYVVVCEAWNKRGMVEQSRKVVLFARPPVVNLSLSSSSIPLGSTTTISCFTAGGDPHLQELQLEFHGLNITLGRFPISRTNSRSAAISVMEPNRTEPVLEYGMPFSVASKRLSVQRVSAVTNRIDVQLKVLAFDHDQNVTCRAIGVKKEFNIEVKKKIQVKD